MKRAFVALFLCGFVNAATITLSLVDGQGLPVRSASVVARHRTTGQEFKCQSNDSGTCSIDLSLRGGYLLSATAPELEGSGEADVADQPVTLTVRLSPLALRTSVSVVSGSRQEELQEQSPIKVEAVTRAQMLTTGYERVSDVLQEMPGVLVRRGSTSTVGGEQIQGVDSRQVAVLQDGLPVMGARGIKSGAINLNRQSSDRLARVEVAKGSASSIYGSDAIGGVINMITREPEHPLEGGFSFSGGNLGIFDGRGDIGGRYKRATYFLNMGQSRMDSYRLIPTSVTTVGPDVSRQDLLFKGRYQFHPQFSLGFTANAYRNREEGRNATETGTVVGLNNDSTQSYALVGDWTVNNATFLQARAYAAKYDENSLSTPISPPGAASPANLNERLNRLDATLSHQLGARHFLQGGAEWAQNLYRGVNRVLGDNVGQQTTATDIWLQDKWTVNRILTLTAGGRVTSHSLFGSAAVPKAGAIVRLNDNWILRGSFGMGFRAPDLGQLYYRFANPASFYQVIGNPNLNPEHSQSFQAGAQYRQRRYRVGVTLFRNNIRDLIDSQLIGTPTTAAQVNAILAANNIPAAFNPVLNRPIYLYRNFSRIFTQGVELDGEYVITRNLRATGAYTYLNALDRNTQLALTQRLRHQGQMRVDYVNAKWGLTTNIRGSFYSHWVLNATSGTRALPYQIWDFYVAKNLTHGFESYFTVDNMANSRDGKLALATPTFDRPDYGRTFRVGLRYRFSRE